ncbi:MAG: CotH kinase family protein [Deltaproteobacteria bacterium]|nr:CotH kinase family protein [Deltaproteobacteria bacterium]
MSARTCIAVLSLSWVALACGPAPGWLDGDAWIFDPDWILQVDIELAPEDWNAMRHQDRSFGDVLCAEAPPPNPFDYFEAAIEIDGIRTDPVGIRKKCFFGSCDTDRPSVKVSFNQYVRGQRFFGLRRMTLNNCKSDPSKIKQCLGYWLFDRGGVIAPRCNFAHVTVNGESKGLYTHIESVKTEMLSRHFTDTGGNLYEGALSDFQPDWVSTFQKKTHEDNPDRSDLDAVVNACAAPDSAFVDELSKRVDLDAFYRFWVMEVLVAHWDGYASFNHNNFYIYHDPDSDRFHFVPWGIDAILFTNPDGHKSVFADAIIPHRLYRTPRTQERYLTLVDEMLSTVWDEDLILAEIDRMESLITPIADSYATGQLAARIEEVRRFVVDNPIAIRSEIDNGPVVWDKALSGPPCWRVRGSLHATFETSWGSISSPDPFGEGSGTFDAVLDDLPVPVSFVASTSGLDPNVEAAERMPMIQVLAIVPDPAGDLLIAAIVAVRDPERLAPGSSVPLDLGEGIGYLLRQDPLNPDGFEIFLLMDGAIRFQQAAMADGAPVVGSVEANIRESGW